MKKVLFFQLLLLTTLFFACQKEKIAPKPKAEFTFLTGVNGKVIFNNLSTDAKTAKWDFGDGSTDVTFDEVLYTYSSNRNYQVSLTVTGEGGTDVIVKTVPISSVKGNLVIYKKYSTRGDRDINVYVDGNYRGFISGKFFYSSAPSCGNANSVTDYNLTEGTHRIEAKETGISPYTWNYTLTVIGGNCNSFGLTL